MDSITQSMSNLSIQIPSKDTNWEDILVSEMKSLKIKKKPKRIRNKRYSLKQLDAMQHTFLGKIINGIYKRSKPSLKRKYTYSKSCCGKYIYKRQKK